MAETDQEVAPSYTANPNQIVYDTPHVVDHEINVLDIYFAKKVQKTKWENKSEVYTVRNGGVISDVVNRYVATNRRNIVTNPNHNNRLRPGEQITVSWEESSPDGFEYVKIDSMYVGAKTFIVAACNGDNGVLKIEIHENKREYEEAVYENPVKFLIGTTEKTSVDFDIKNDKDPDAGLYIKEITLRPQSNDELITIGQNFEKRTDKKGWLFLKATVTGTTDEIKFANDLNEFLNADTNKFQVKYCACNLYTVDSEGYIVGAKITKNVIASCNNRALSGQVAIIVLHRTAGGAASGTLSHMATEGYGAHFVVDYDGKIYHAISLNNAGSHIGRGQFAATIAAGWGNGNSIGIETCGYSYNEAGEKRVGSVGNDTAHSYWETVTPAQADSVACLVNFLLMHYNLQIGDVKAHENICSKEPMEGQTVLNAIQTYL